MSKKDSEVSAMTKTTHETIKQQLQNTGENIDRRTAELRAKVAARFSTRVQRPRADDLPLSAMKAGR